MKGVVFGKSVRAHRAAWAIHYGVWPEGEIDHINGIPSDNRISNLRDVTHKENGRNTRLSKANTSGVAGVYFRPEENKWHAKIVVDGETINIGRFATLADAAKARKQAEDQYGFHENHGLPPVPAKYAVKPLTVTDRCKILNKVEKLWAMQRDTLKADTFEDAIIQETERRILSALTTAPVTPQQEARFVIDYLERETGVGFGDFIGVIDADRIKAIAEGGE